MSHDQSDRSDAAPAQTDVVLRAELGRQTNSPARDGVPDLLAAPFVIQDRARPAVVGGRPRHRCRGGRRTRNARFEYGSMPVLALWRVIAPSVSRRSPSRIRASASPLSLSLHRLGGRPGDRLRRIVAVDEERRRKAILRFAHNNPGRAATHSRNRVTGPRFRGPHRPRDPVLTHIDDDPNEFGRSRIASDLLGARRSIFSAWPEALQRQPDEVPVQCIDLDAIPDAALLISPGPSGLRRITLAGSRAQVAGSVNGDGGSRMCATARRPKLAM